MLKDLKKELYALNDPERATFSKRFFKTGPGEYAEGDLFLGTTVPQLRTLAKKYKDLPLEETLELLHSKIHEERQIALFILVKKFSKSDQKGKKEIFQIYLENIKYVNNWDLVDGSAEYIIGAFLWPETASSKSLLKKLAKSKNLWEKRIAIMSTFHYIKNGSAKTTLELAEILLHDKHDLIHKAAGWMLREVGKRISPAIEEKFLGKNAQKMPRTMLRYAVEHFPEDTRKYYLNLKNNS